MAVAARASLRNLLTIAGRAASSGFRNFTATRLRVIVCAAAQTEPTEREILTVDQIVRALDAARVDIGMSKAELARCISAKPEIVRRLFTDERANPTLATVVKIAAALRSNVELVPAAPRQVARTAREQVSRRTRRSYGSTVLGSRARNSSPSARTRA
jgi:transcriptional regulator with XRE-family HTH domain